MYILQSGFDWKAVGMKGKGDSAVLFIQAAALILIAPGDQSSTNMMFSLSVVNEINRDMVLLFLLMLRVAHGRWY